MYFDSTKAGDNDGNDDDDDDDDEYEEVPEMWI